MSRLFSLKSYGLSILAVALAVTFTPAANAQTAIAKPVCHNTLVEHGVITGTASRDPEHYVPKTQEVCSQDSVSDARQPEADLQTEQPRQPDTDTPQEDPAPQQ
jgi:hypothetical protein